MVHLNILNLNDKVEWSHRQSLKLCPELNYAEVFYSDNKSHRFEKVEIYHVESFPKMRRWVRLENNFLVDESKTSTFKTSCNTKMKINDYAFNENKTIALDNAEVLKRLVKVLWKIYSSKFEISEDPEQQNPNIIFEIIASVFPLQTSKAKLIKRFENSKISSQEESTPKISTIDDSSASPLSVDQALHSFKTLFCRRCYQYNCFLHKPEIHGVSKRSPKGPALKPLDKPCSSYCYMNDPYAYRSDHNEAIKSNDKTPKNKLKKSTKSCDSFVNTEITQSTRFELHFVSEYTSNEPWYGDEITLFRVLHKSFGNNYCAIAQGILTKTCEQVYQYSLKDDSINCSDSPQDSYEEPKKKKMKKASIKNWYNSCYKKGLKTDFSKDTHLHNYSPCYHPGKPCNEVDCICLMNKNFCEKFCHCSPDCKYRFLGCSCTTVCKNKMCRCFFAVRECDPDLCTKCCSNEFDTQKIRCTNVSIQKKIRKRLRLSRSTKTGWGIFAKDPIKMNEFISEYCGEIISHEEANKRLKTYLVEGNSFMFDLNKDCVIDATSRGNKVRFLNHSYDPNCYAKIMMVNGDQKIGIYAKKEIKKGEELFMNFYLGNCEEISVIPDTDE